VRHAARVAAPLVVLTVAGALASSILDLFRELPPNLDTAVFAKSR